MSCGSSQRVAGRDAHGDPVAARQHKAVDLLRRVPLHRRHLKLAQQRGEQNMRLGVSEAAPEPRAMRVTLRC